MDGDDAGVGGVVQTPVLRMANFVDGGQSQLLGRNANPFQHHMQPFGHGEKSEAHTLATQMPGYPSEQRMRGVWMDGADQNGRNGRNGKRFAVHVLAFYGET